MRNLLIFLVLASVLGAAMMLGDKSMSKQQTPEPSPTQEKVPHIGRIEVLNGCGITGAAGRVSDYLRAQRFDVKREDNAESWNYPFTMVVSRIADMTIARQVAQSLGTDKCIMLRSEAAEQYDVTVFVGADYEERIQ